MNSFSNTATRNPADNVGIDALGLPIFNGCTWTADESGWTLTAHDAALAISPREMEASVLVDAEFFFMTYPERLGLLVAHHSDLIPDEFEIVLAFHDGDIRDVLDRDHHDHYYGFDV